MQIKRQEPNQTIPKPPGNVDKNKYGEIFATIDGQIYCRDKNGYPKSIASTAKYANEAANASSVNNHSVNADVPQSASFNNTTYAFSEGTIDGSFRVDWSIAGPTSIRDSGTNVKIHGLGTAAYKNSTDFASPADLRNINAVSLGGSSLSDIINYIDRKTNSGGSGGGIWG